MSGVLGCRISLGHSCFSRGAMSASTSSSFDAKWFYGDGDQRELGGCQVRSNCDVQFLEDPR